MKTAETDISVSIDIDPDTLNLDVHGNWITAYIEPLDGYKVNDINVSTIWFYHNEEPITEAIRATIEKDTLIVKFDATQVVSYIWIKIVYHMGRSPMPQDNIPVPLTVTGELYDGTTFEVSDEIRVIAPPP